MPEASKNFIVEVSKASNTQNPLKKSDFFSFHPFHQKMHAHSKSIAMPKASTDNYSKRWFYERFRGEYKTKLLSIDHEDRNKFKLQFPSHQVLRKIDVARYWNAWNVRPWFAVLDEAKCMKAFAELIERDEAKKYNYQNYYKDTVTLAIVYKYLNNEIKKQLWYNQDSIFRISDIILYTMAFTSYRSKLSYKYKIDFTKIWNNQEVYKEASSLLLSHAKFIFDKMKATQKLSVANPHRRFKEFRNGKNKNAFWNDVISCIVN